MEHHDLHPESIAFNMHAAQRPGLTVAMHAIIAHSYTEACNLHGGCGGTLDGSERMARTLAWRRERVEPTTRCRARTSCP